MLFTTAKPAHDFGGYAKARAGEYGFLEFEGAVNLPVGPKLTKSLKPDVTPRFPSTHD